MDIACRPEPLAKDPLRTVCAVCRGPVLAVELGGVVIFAEPFEWEPRASCERCRRTRSAWPGKRVSCARCGNEGYVGERRPAVQMLAIDMAWSDVGHVRLVGPRMARRRGEGLYALHSCSLAQAA